MYCSRLWGICEQGSALTSSRVPAPLFPPINQWGHLPSPINPLTRHATSVLARQIHTGIPVHRDLNVGGVIDVLNPTEAPTKEQTVSRPVYDWAAANQKKKDAIAQLASLSATMDEMDDRINALVERTRNLELD